MKPLNSQSFKNVDSAFHFHVWKKTKCQYLFECRRLFCVKLSHLRNFYQTFGWFSRWSWSSSRIFWLHTFRRLNLTLFAFTGLRLPIAGQFIRKHWQKWLAFEIHWRPRAIAWQRFGTFTCRSPCHIHFGRTWFMFRPLARSHRQFVRLSRGGTSIPHHVFVIRWVYHENPDSVRSKHRDTYETFLSIFRSYESDWFQFRFKSGSPWHVVVRRTIDQRSGEYFVECARTQAETEQTTKAGTIATEIANFTAVPILPCDQRHHQRFTAIF